MAAEFFEDEKISKEEREISVRHAFSGLTRHNGFVTGMAVAHSRCNRRSDHS